MALIELQAGLFFCPKPPNEQLVRDLRNAIARINEAMAIQLRPMDDVNGRVLDGDPEAFETNGKQLFLLYDETRPFDDRTDSSLHVMFQDDYPDCAAVYIGPELTEPTPEQTDYVWRWLIEIVNQLNAAMRPALAQINGMDEESTGHLVSAKTLRGSLPQFFTPYTYLDDSLADEIPARLEQAGAYRVSRVGSGWAIQFVESLSRQPSRAVMEALRSALGIRKTPYRQTRVEPD